MAQVTINSGEFPLMRNVDIGRQPERASVYNEWSRAFNDRVPWAVDHLADVIEDVYAFELWKDKFLDTPEQFFERIGILGLNLEDPAKLIKELRKKHGSPAAKIMRRSQAAKALREQGKTQREIKDRLGVSVATVKRDQKRSVHINNDPKPERKVIQYKISQYTQPKTAAAKIRATFGDVFADQLKAEL